MHFDFPADEAFFHELLCDPEESLSQYYTLFDFRDSTVKRKEFNRYRAKLFAQLLQAYGCACQLQFPSICTSNGTIVVDHIIPLSSNTLNKRIRNLVSVPGRKVPAQSFGSNHFANLAIACSRCNAYKKNNFLERDHLKLVLQRKQQS